MTEPEKSVLDLEKEKLEIEIELLKQNLEKEKKEGKKHIFEGIRKYTGLSLAIVSVIVALFGVILPVNDYFEKKKKEMIPTLNNEIIDLVNELSNENEREQEKATVMLSYYGLDAVPLLLFRLERADEAERDQLIQVIKNAHEDNPKGVLDVIISALSEEFEKNYKKYDPDEMSYEPKFDNYFVLLLNLDLSKKEKKILRTQLEDFENKIPDAISEDFQYMFTSDLNKLCNHFEMDSIQTIN